MLLLAATRRKGRVPSYKSLVKSSSELFNLKITDILCSKRKGLSFKKKKRETQPLRFELRRTKSNRFPVVKTKFKSIPLTNSGIAALVKERTQSRERKNAFSYLIPNEFFATDFATNFHYIYFCNVSRRT